MKKTHVQRGIQQISSRKVGSAPTIGKVSRIPRTLAKKSRSHRSRGNKRESFLSEKILAHRRRTIIILSACLILAAFGVITGFMVLWLRAHLDGEEIAPPTIAESSLRIASKFPSPTEDESLAIVRKALAVTEPAKVDACIRAGGATAEEIIAFMKESESRDGHIDNIEVLNSMDVEDLLIEGVLITYSKNNETNARLAMLVPDDEGVWKMDFDAFARSSRPTWRELIRGNATEAEVRVFVARDTYFNGPFKDEKEWSCYAMVSPDTRSLLPEDKELLRGYCKADSPQAKAMARIFTGDVRLSRATLKIRRQPGADPRQFEIVRVLGQDWALPPDPYDEKFH